MSEKTQHTPEPPMRDLVRETQAILHSDARGRRSEWWAHIHAVYLLAEDYARQGGRMEEAGAFRRLAHEAKNGLAEPTRERLEMAWGQAMTAREKTRDSVRGEMSRQVAGQGSHL